MIKQFKLLTILGSVGILGGVSTFSILTTSCGNGSDNGPTEKIDISSIIQSTNLGDIDNNSQPAIQQAIIQKNSATATWAWDQLNFSIGNDSATISALHSSKLYTGTVVVSFTLPAHKIDIADFITVINLGEIDNNHVQTIIDAIIDANGSKTDDIVWDQIKIQVEDGCANVSPVEWSTLYTGSLTVYFTIPVPTPKIPINTFITNTILNEIANNELMTIQNAIITMNPFTTGDIAWEQIQFTNISSTGARVSAMSFSTLYDGYVDVAFTLITKIIDRAIFDSDLSYQVSVDTQLYVTENKTIEQHNVLFDLKKYADDNGGVTSFIISGIIDFGLLIDFNQNVELYGELEGVMEITDLTTTNVYSLIVGSTDENDAINNGYSYSGIMNIHNNVNCVIATTNRGANVAELVGIYFGKTSDKSIINIAGNFQIGLMQEKTYGANVMISGVVVQNEAGGNITISGNFIILGADCTISGVNFRGGTATNSIQNISGNFYIRSWSFSVTGVDLLLSALGSITISGNFSLSSNHIDANIVGAYFFDADGDITISGNFVLDFYANEEGRPYAFGVYFTESPTTCLGTPHFYSNKIDSGNWSINTKGGQQEYWNNELTTVGSSVTTVADDELQLEEVFDTQDNVPDDAHFGFSIITAGLIQSITAFNGALVDAFSQFPDGYINWTNLINNISLQ